MVLGACDANGDREHDYSASGGFNGMGPDGAQHALIIKWEGEGHKLGTGPNTIVRA